MDSIEHPHRLNFVTPLPPLPTEIANHSALVLGALAQRRPVVAWTSQMAWDPVTDYEVRHFAIHNVPVAALAQPGTNFYNIGNNSRFHAAIWEASRRVPGVVILHDTTLQHFFQAFANSSDGFADYVAMMGRCHGADAVTAAFARGDMDMAEMMHRFPMTQAAFDGSRGVVVHNEAEARRLRRLTTIPVWYVPLAAPAMPSAQTLRRRRAKRLRLIVFGHIGSNRRLVELVRALGGSAVRERYRLDVYGNLDEPAPVMAEIAAHGLTDQVSLHGFVPAAQLDQALVQGDLAINLRHPTVGEASSSQLRIWGNGLPSLVTQAGWYAGLSPDMVSFVRADHEAEDIERHLVAFATDPEPYRANGRAGRDHVAVVHRADAYADALVDIAAELSRPRVVHVPSLSDYPPGGARLEGNVDSVSDTLITGWARCCDGSKPPPLVRAFIGDRLIAETRADGFRDDVRRVGLGDGHCGFALLILPGHPSLREAPLSIVAVAGDEQALLLRQMPGDAPAESEAGPSVADLHFTIAGHVNGTYSLAAVNRDVASALEARRPGTVRLVPVEGDVTDFLGEVPAEAQSLVTRLVGRSPPSTGPEVVISQHYPVYVPQYRGDLTLAMVFWEESVFPPATVRALNNGFDAVLAPSAFVARLLVDSGVSCPVINVGQGPKLDHFAALVRRPAATLFSFLHVSSAFPRKGVDVLLAAWQRAFRASDKVRLVIKSFPNPQTDVVAQVDRLRAVDPDIAPIHLIHRDLDEAAQLALFAEANAMVLPTRGEGYNLPAAEAMAAGVPVIVTDVGGQSDFCNPTTARLVRSRPAPSITHVTTPHSLWREPDVAELAIALREIVDGVPDGQVAAARAMIDRVANRDAFADRLGAIASGLLRAPAVCAARLAWITTWDVRCGIANYARALLDAMPRTGIARLAILCDDRTPGDGGAVRPCWDLDPASGIDALVTAVRDEDADLVMIQHQPGLLSWSNLAALVVTLVDDGRAVVVTLHNTLHLLDIGEAERSGCVAALGRVGRILVHTVADLLRLEALGLLPTMLPHGAPAGGPPRPARPLPPGAAPVVGCYGFFLPGKGIGKLIEAVAALRETWPGIRLRLVNAEYDPFHSAAEIASCRALATALGMAVEWHQDYLEEAESLALLAGCDLITLPYAPSREASSAAVRSALASGVPVAVSPISLFDELGDAVARLPGGDATAIAEGLASLLADPARRTQVARHAARWLADRAVPDIARRLHGVQLGLVAQRRLGIPLDGRLVQALSPRDPDRRRERPAPVIHIDVGDLLHFFTQSRTPSGIQRVQVGLITHWLAAPERRARLRFTLYSSETHQFHPVPPEEIEWLLDSLTQDADADHRPARIQAITRAAIRSRALRPGFGDALLVIGIFWSNPGYHRAIREMQVHSVLRYVQFFHDAVPVTVPETVHYDNMLGYTRALGQMLHQADAVCAVSHHAAGDLRMLAARLGLPCPPIEVAYHGSPPPFDDASVDNADLPPGLGEFVLCVGTIEPRKNHLYLFHVWRRLLGRGGRPTPKLVCAGQYGWLNEDLQRYLQATGNLGGHFVILPGVSDAQLRALYRHCRFTIYPSLYEGWGLPVTESLAAGRLCVTSNFSSMPEAGGRWAAFIDPYDINSGFDVVAGLIDEPGKLEAANAAIRDHYQPLGWAERAVTTWAIIEGLVEEAGIAQRPIHRPPLLRMGEDHRLLPAIPSVGPLAHTRTALAGIEFSQILFGPDWNGVEPWGVWAKGTVARLVFQTETVDDDNVIAYLRVGLPEVSGANWCRVEVNGREVAVHHLRPGPQTIRVALERGGRIRLDIMLAHAVSVAGDLRQLGIGLHRVFVCCGSDVAARLAFLEGLS